MPDVKRCGNCRYWSDLRARVEKTGIEALCLASTGAHANKYTLEAMHCESWNYGDPIDLPLDTKIKARG